MDRRLISPDVLPLITDRWSPRSFDASHIDEKVVTTIFEAASWAPSAFNVQPWRFLYAHRETADWERFLELLLPFNVAWAKEASVLGFILSDRMMGQGEEAKPNHSHSFDAGAAWALLTLQALAMGYHTHGMTGVDFDAAQRELQVPERYRIEAAFVIGRKDSPDKLPEKLREREAPSSRKPVSQVAIDGPFDPRIA